MNDSIISRLSIVSIALLFPLSLLTGCAGIKEKLCSDSDLDFIERRDSACYKPSYTPSATALEAAKAKTPILIREKIVEEIRERLFNRRCESFCTGSSRKKCSEVSELLIENGELSTEKTEDRRCVEANNNAERLAELQCNTCKSSVEDECLEASGAVKSSCLLPGDEPSEQEVQLRIQREQKDLDNLYQRLLSD